VNGIERVTPDKGLGNDLEFFERLAATMKHRVLVDGRNVWQQYLAAEHGFTCHAIGRPSISFTD
jgi:hypothetical protein